MTHTAFARALLASCALLALSPLAHAQSASTSASPWPAGDELGMANSLGPATWKRCAPYLADPKAKSYELSYLRSNTMPQSPFGTPLVDKYRPTVGIPGTMHAFNGEETVSGEPGAQGTQMDAIGHFAVLPEKWDGKGEFPADKAKYAKDIEAMLKAQGLGKRGLQAGDVLYIYTGWGDNWKDPDTEKFYYTKGPGLAYDAAKLIEQKKVVLVALDNPFTDPVADGFLQGKAAPPEGTPDGLPFAIHHYNLAHSGIHQIQNANLGALAKDKVWLSCTMILPLRAQGASGSPVRPVSIGAPSR
jgi:kynurenine formamidase